MKYVIGIDLGTSAVKALLVGEDGNVAAEASEEYPLYHEQSGYSEQDPEDWYQKTVSALQTLVKKAGVSAGDVEGISFSGQMHGLVLLDQNGRVVRRAILWNDTRTTKQCRDIESKLGKDTLFKITKNPALEGFTLPKLLWVKEREPNNYEQASHVLLPKDYVRYRLTGTLHMDLSDAAGTLLLDVEKKEWSREICGAFDIDPNLLPPLVNSLECTGNLLPEIAEETGLSKETKVFAGGADNACGAVGSGILSDGMTLCSIGTSGVLLSYESRGDRDFKGKVHYFNHGKPDAFYTMGVTLAAGYSLSWFKKTFAPEQEYDDLLSGIEEIPPGSQGLLFTPYIVGERTPHADADIRGSFIGMDGSHTVKHFARSVLEGITFSLNESMQIFRESGKNITSVVSIGGGAKNPTWLQMQADIFQTPVIPLANEQGPGLGAAMMAACGCGWFDDLDACAKTFVKYGEAVEPDAQASQRYADVFAAYQSVYAQTKDLSARLKTFRA